MFSEDALLTWNIQKINTIMSLLISYIVTTGGIISKMLKDLLAESIEYCFENVEKLPHAVQWLTDNGSIYTARDTIAFTCMMGLEVCTTLYYSPESNGMAEYFIKTFKQN